MILATVLFQSLLFATSFAAPSNSGGGSGSSGSSSKTYTIFAGTYNGELLTFTYDYGANTIKLVNNQTLGAPFNNPNPSWLEPFRVPGQTSKHRWLVTDESDVGNIQVVERHGNSVKLIGTTPSGGVWPAHCGSTADGKWVIAANYGDGTVLPIPLNPDGSFAKASVKQPILNYNTSKTAPSHPHQAVNTPTGTILINDLGLDQIHEIALNKKSGVWETIGKTDVTPTGSGPRHSVFSSDGSVYYLLSELQKTLQIFKVSKTTPLKLTHVSTTSMLPPGAVPINGTVLAAAEIQLSKDGKFLYTSNRNQDYKQGDAITIFKLTSPTTVSEPVYVRSEGQHLRGIKLSDDNAILLAGNMLSWSVSVFKRDANTGGLTLATIIDLPEGTQVTSFLIDP
ncbi:putative isomerase YbhE [Atractiella rhizophila]|nr:putative isomerase YbhE [Atractiella rhizophila]